MGSKIWFMFLMVELCCTGSSGLNWAPLPGFSTYQRKKLDTSNIVIWSSGKADSEVFCAMSCSSHYGLNKSCNAYQFNETTRRCDLFRLENERYVDWSHGQSNQTIIRVNSAMETSLSNYMLAAVGQASIGFALHFAGDNKNCPSNNVDASAQISEAAFPPGMKGLVYTGLAFSFKTSTLVACGGLQKGSYRDQDCWTLKLIGPGVKAWMGPYQMGLKRMTPGMVAVKDKVYIIGGEIFSSEDETNNFVEVLDTNNGSITKVSNNLYPFSNGGLYFACLAALPYEDNFVITGGEEYRAAGTFEVMPSLPSARSYHGCDIFRSSASTYLVVFGGNSHLGAFTAPYTAFDDILLLDLNSLGRGWFKINGVKLGQAAMFINGGIVKEVSVSNCDMMFAAFDNVSKTQKITACKGNYTWTTTTVTAGAFVPYHRLAPVGINILSPCV